MSKEFKLLEVNAVTDELDRVTDFLNQELEERDFSMKAVIAIDVAVEEIFVNIAHYAYGEDNIGGYAAVGIAFSDDGSTAYIRFQDKGVPYNPLEKKDPDITLSVEERGIGGLGIYMVKKSMDNVEYEYSNGMNILTLTKTK